MSFTNTENIKPYINADYYTGAYKPELNARIEGPYNKVEEHKENFDPFRQKASWIVNRLNNNAIDEQGGIEAIPASSATWNMKATAALVEYWYLNDYKIGDINASFSTGNVSIKRVKANESIRKFIPETVLSFIQLGGLSKQSVAFINTRYEQGQGYGNHNGSLRLTYLDFFTKDEARALFQQKGEFDNNFHKSIDIQGELTGIDQDKYFKIAEINTDEQDGRDITFSFIGGVPENKHQSKYYISAVLDANNNIDLNESGVVSLNPNADDPNFVDNEFLARVDNSVFSIWVKSKDFGITNFLISDIAADNDAIFKNYGSQTDLPVGAELLNQVNIKTQQTDIDNLQDQINVLDNRVNAIDVEIADLPAMRININNNTTLATDSANQASAALTEATKAQAEAEDALTLAQQNKAELDGKLNRNIGVSEQGKVLQVNNSGDLVAIPLGNLAPDVIGIDVDDPILQTTAKRLNTAINELLLTKVAYRNNGANFTLNGTNDTDYNLDNMEVNAEGLKAVMDTIDNVLFDASTNVSIPVSTPIAISGNSTQTADVSALDFSMVGIGFDVFIKIEDTDTGATEIIRDSFNNNATTPASYFSDNNVNVALTDTTLTITGVSNAEQDNKQIIEIEYKRQGTSVDVSSKANITLDNVSDNTILTKGSGAGLATKIELQATETIAKKAEADAAANKQVVDQLADKDVSGGKLLDTAETLATEKFVNDKIVFYEGELKEFIKEKTGTKFEDNTLFDKHLIADGQTIVGGTDASITNGEVISHTHTQAGHTHPLLIPGNAGQKFGNGDNYNPANQPRGGLSGWWGANEPVPHYYEGGGSGSFTQSKTPLINSTGGAHNKAYGIKLLKVVYVAKKDITQAEME